MQNRVFRILPSAVVTLLAVTASACGGGESSPPGAAKPNSATTPPASAGSSVSSTKAPATKAEAMFKSAGGSAASGTATLNQAADKVDYHIEVSGTSPGSHAMYLVQNATCAPGNRTGPLSPLEAAADGNGTADGTIAGQLVTLLGRSFAVYASDKGDSEIIACGQISAAQ